MGTTHLCLLAAHKPLHRSLTACFLRPTAREGVLRRRFHSELPLCIGSLLVAYLVLCSFNAGQFVLYCLTKGYQQMDGKVNGQNTTEVTYRNACLWTL